MLLGGVDLRTGMLLRRYDKEHYITVTGEEVLRIFHLMFVAS
jgi:hypothetical protein